MRLSVHSRILGVAIGAAAMLAVPVAQTPADNTLSSAEQAAGWRLLFDGKNVDQWRGFKMQTLPPGWAAESGALVHTPGEGTRDLISKDQFGDFDFQFDWQLQERGNSGVMFYVTEAGSATYHTGPEYQLLHNAGHRDGKNPLTSAGACYALYAPAKDATKPVGEWNRSRIIVDKGHAEHWLNSEKVVEYEIGSPDWLAKVAGSKFKEWKEFGLARRGHLALQEHGGRVAYKNLKIRTLN